MQNGCFSSHPWLPVLALFQCWRHWTLSGQHFRANRGGRSYGQPRHMPSKSMAILAICRPKRSSALKDVACPDQCSSTNSNRRSSNAILRETCAIACKPRKSKCSNPNFSTCLLRVPEELHHRSKKTNELCRLYGDNRQPSSIGCSIPVALQTLPVFSNRWPKNSN